MYFVLHPLNTEPVELNKMLCDLLPSIVDAMLEMDSDMELRSAELTRLIRHMKKVNYDKKVIRDLIKARDLIRHEEVNQKQSKYKLQAINEFLQERHDEQNVGWIVSGHSSYGPI